MASIFEPDELEWDRAPRLSASLIDFIQTDAGARFLDLDYSTIFNPEYTNLTNPAGARNQYMALSYDGFAAVRVAYETENPNIIAHMEDALEVIGALYPDFKLDADDVIAQMQNEAEVELNVTTSEPELDTVTPNYLVINNQSLAEELYSRYDRLFNDDQEHLAAHAYRMADGYAIEGATLDDFRQMLVHDNFKLIRDALALKNEDTNELIVDVIDTLNDAYPGFSSQMRAQSNEIDEFFTLFEEGVLTEHYLELDRFVNNNIKSIENGELDPADYIGNLADYIDQGIYSEQFIQQAFAHDNFKFTDFLRGLDNDEVNSALDTLFDKLWENNSPELSAENNISIDDAPVIPSIDEAPVIMSAPLMPSLPEIPPSGNDGDIIPNQEEVTANPPPPPPPPGAAALQGLIRPNISTAPALTLNEALNLTKEIKERLENLPEDSDALQVELRDISNDLEEIAIALTPNVAGDPRFSSLPPTSADPNDFDQALSELTAGVGAAVNQVSHAELTELLIQNSQQAAIVARSIDYIGAPEVVKENAPANVLDRPDVEVPPNVETVPDTQPEIEPETDIVAVPSIDYSSINRPESVDPNNAATYGITNNVIVDPSAVSVEDPLETLAEPPVETLSEPPEVLANDPGVAPADVVPEAGTAKVTVYLETDMSVNDVREILSSESFQQYDSDVWMSNTTGSSNRLWVGRPDGDITIDTARELAQALANEGLSPKIMVDGEIIDEGFVASAQNPVASGADIAPSEIIRPQPRPADLFAENADSAGLVTGQPLIRPQPRPDSVAQTPPDEVGTRTRLSELLDGRGYHNDADGYTDYDAMQDAFKRSGELGITTEHIEIIRVTLNSPNFILQTSAAIEALNAYNTSMESGNEANALSAFFNTLAPEDFVPDLEDSIDDRSVYDQAERDSTHERTVHIENNILPKL